MNPVAFRLLRRNLATRGRVLFAVGVGALILLGAIGIAGSGAPRRALPDFLQGPGLGFLVPIVSLVFAAGSLGDLVEDRTLVYVWLRPVAPWRLALSALAATTAVAVPLTVVPMGLATLVAGRADLLVAAVLASTAAAVAYAALFTGLGLRTKRSLVWGVLYVVLWEDVFSNVSADLAVISVRRYSASLLDALDVRVDLQFPVGPVTSVVGVLVATTVGVAATSWFLSRQDVD